MFSEAPLDLNFHLGGKRRADLAPRALQPSHYDIRLGPRFSAFGAVGGRLWRIPAVIALAGCIGSLALIAQRSQRMDGGLLDPSVDIRRLSLCIGLACVILVFGGDPHLFFAPLDWRIRDALLADLTQGQFPIVYNVADTPVQRREATLRNSDVSPLR